MAVTFGLAQHGRVDMLAVGQTLIGTVLFLAASFTLGRRAVFRLIRWANDNLVSEAPVIAMILVIMGVMALTTHAIGVHTVLGAFVAGMLVGQSPILTRHIDERLRGLIAALFMPVFFGMAGLTADLRVLGDGSMLLLSLGMVVIASIGKFAGAFVGAAIGGMTWREALALACGMNARGSTEVIVATLGLSMGVLSEALFTMIVAMAVVTTMAMPPMLRWALSRVPLRPDEKERLEREEFEARGFITNIERLLVAVDQSPSGRFASCLVGLLAGARRIPTTVLPLDEDGAKRPREFLPRLAGLGGPAAPEPSEAQAVVQAIGEKVEAQDADAETAPPLDVVTRRPAAPAERAVADEARKGYDFLVIALEPAFEDGAFTPRVTRVADEFEGPFAIVVARGPNRDDPDCLARDILVPVTGTGFSRRGAEVAIAMARASHGTVTALYVTGRSRGHWQYGRGGIEPGEGNAILREIVGLGEHQGVAVRPVRRRHMAAEMAILEALASGAHELVVMGVSRRPGETLFFGGVPNAVLDRSNRSVVLLSS
jgi:nucleotide-binding universal stress UspA family protein